MERARSERNLKNLAPQRARVVASQMDGRLCHVAIAIMPSTSSDGTESLSHAASTRSRRPST